MTTEDLEAIKARADKATPGPWERPDEGWLELPGGVWLPAKGNNLVPYVSNNLDFIAHAREDVPALVAEVERLRALLDAVAPEGGMGDDNCDCVWCNTWNRSNHEPDCPWVAARKALEGTR